MQMPMTLVVAMLTMAPLAPPPQAQPQQTVTVDALSWMAGHWIGVNTNDISEELWLPPAAGAMVGMWRWATDGQMRLYELLTITAEGPGVALRLRHFRPNLNALEEKDAPFVLPAVTLGQREVIFEGPGREGLLRIGYRSPTPTTLEAFVERGGKRETFSYRRK